MFKKIVTNPYTNMAVAMTLMISGIAEVFHDLSDVSPDFVGAHHGAIVFGGFHMLKSLAEVFEAGRGVEELEGMKEGRPLPPVTPETE